MSDINPYQPGVVAAQLEYSGPIEFPGRQIKLSLVYDMDYLIEAVSRFRQREIGVIPRALWMFAKWTVLLFLTAVSFLAIGVSRLHQLWLPLLILALVLAAIFIRQLNNLFLRWKFRSISYLNQTYSVTLSDEGYQSEASGQQAKLAWPVFLRVVEFPDGVLLFQTQLLYYWLPFRNLENPDDSSILYRYVSSRVLQDRKTEQVVVPKGLEPADQASGRLIKANIIYSPSFLMESLARFRRVDRTATKAAIWYAVLFCYLGMGILVLLLTDRYWLSIPLFALAFYKLLFIQLQNFFVRRKHRASPSCNEQFVITVSDSGYHAQSNRQNVKLAWNNFTSATAFPDGVVLSRGPGLCHWVPFRCLEKESDSATLYDYVSSSIASSRSSTKVSPAAKTAGL